MAAVDTEELSGHPTGLAADFAALHTAPHSLTLYGGWFCPFVQRAWIVLHEKRIAHQYVEVNPYRKTAEFLALSPRGLVPALAVADPSDKQGGSRKPLFESLVLCEYLDDAYGDETQHGKPLLPRGSDPEAAYARARCRLWIDHVATRIIPAFYRVLQHTPDKAYSIAQAREEFLGHIRTFVKEMADGPWFLGETFSLVDVMLAPWAKRLFLIDYYKDGGVGIPKEGGEGDDEVWTRWRVWFDAIEKRQSVKDTWSDDEAYVKAYKRYADDTTQSEVAKATRSGGRLP
ncbi:glutathione S-transferase [Nemania sp. FL0916]|nr:glutathione S-transferase [Nemania sp. FL0916]